MGSSPTAWLIFMKRTLIFIFNWLALFTYFLWATIAICFLGYIRKKDFNETTFEFIKEMLSVIVVAILLPSLFVISAIVYASVRNQRHILFNDGKILEHRRFENYDACLTCYLITLDKLPITSFGDCAFGSGLDSIRKSYKFTIGNLCNNVAVKRDRSLI